MSLSIRLETISPKKALAWLKNNSSNRAIKKSVVDRYAKAISNDEWRVNGESIKFNGAGKLIDGQHRLLSVIAAGKSIKVYVVNGLEDDCFDTIDQGNSRSISDVFSKYKEEHYATLAASIGWLFRHRCGAISKRLQLRTAQAVKMLQDHPGIRHCCAISSKIRARKVVSVGMFSCIYYLCRTIDLKLADSFWKSVATGENLVKDDPAYRLRDKMMLNKNKIKEAKLSQPELWALCIKAWNYEREGVRCKKLSWNSEREEMPELI